MKIIELDVNVHIIINGARLDVCQYDGETEIPEGGTCFDFLFQSSVPDSAKEDITTNVLADKPVSVQNISNVLQDIEEAIDSREVGDVSTEARISNFHNPGGDMECLVCEERLGVSRVLEISNSRLHMRCAEELKESLISGIKDNDEVFISSL